MNTTFRRIAKLNGYQFVHLNTGEPAWELRSDKREFFLAEQSRVESISDQPAIFVDYHATTPDLSEIDRARGLHTIRDPRDMLISAIRYHLISEESWLDQPDPAYNGQTFRDKLKGYSNYDDQLRFEIETYMGEEIQRMADFLDRPDHHRVFRTLRYEELINDEDMTQFHAHCVHLGMQGTDLINALSAYWQSSIFGGMKSAHQSGAHPHIRHAGSEQWRSALTSHSIELIQTALGSQISKLGYELV